MFFPRTSNYTFLTFDFYAVGLVAALDELELLLAALVGPLLTQFRHRGFFHREQQAGQFNCQPVVHVRVYFAHSLGFGL